MLASRFGATALPDNMADDTMEISSETGHNIGDEDIDIDIDFTAGHVDEDYVLEDATSNTGFGDEFHAQPSPAVGHDDLMIDEDDESYSMPMDGADVMQDDDAQNMEDEALAMSFAPANIPNVLVEEGHSRDTSHLAADGSMKDEVSWETNDEPEEASNQADVNLEDPKEEHHESHQEEDGDLQEGTDIKEVEAPDAGTPREDSRPNTPRNISPKVDTVGEEPRSPPASISAPNVESQDHGTEHSADVLGISSASQDIVSTIETSTAEETTSVSLSHEVVVVYQNSEYSLFSKSETDDIDSYFLSDLSIKEKPLSNLFEAIRDVIRDDLNDEDELCISIEDLGLEIEEVSCISTHVQQAALTYSGQMSSLTEGITMAQIINLREKLLQNDGVESVRPLGLLLGTRPNFLTRFANLISGASEGKGLSELVNWDEQSESFDDSAHVTENELGEELEDESYETDGRLRDVEEKEASEEQQQESFDDNLAQEPTTEQEPPQETGDAQSVDASGTATTNDSKAQPTATKDVLPLQKTEASDSGEYDEDGDLIDYSDVEDEARPELRKDAKPRPTNLETDDHRSHNGTFTDFIPPCLRPNTCFCSKCNDLLLAEYEAINEDLRRRSISRTAEDNLLEQGAELSVANEGGVYDHGTKLEAENGMEYNENDEEDFEQGSQDPGHEDAPADFDEDHTVEFDNHEDEFYIEDSDIEGGEVLEDDEPTLELISGAGQENFDEFDFGEDDDTQHQNHSIFADQESQSHNYHNTAGERTAPLSKETFSIGSSLGFADAPDSESAASERTLEAQPVSTADLTAVLNEENEDEIDYDDDEEPDVLEVEVQEPNMKVLQPMKSGPGKRQRADDDGTSMGSKGMY